MKNKLNSMRVKTLFYLILFSVFILLVLWGIQLVMSNFLYEKYQMRDVQKIAKEQAKLDINFENAKIITTPWLGVGLRAGASLQIGKTWLF